MLGQGRITSVLTLWMVDDFRGAYPERSGTSYRRNSIVVFRSSRVWQIGPVFRKEGAILRYPFQFAPTYTKIVMYPIAGFSLASSGLVIKIGFALCLPFGVVVIDVSVQRMALRTIDFLAEPTWQTHIVQLQEISKATGIMMQIVYHYHDRTGRASAVCKNAVYSRHYCSYFEYLCPNKLPVSSKWSWWPNGYNCSPMLMVLAVRIRRHH